MTEWLIEGILLLALLIVMISLFAKQKGNKAIIALAGAVSSYMILFFFEQANPALILDFMFGSEADNYVNFNSILLFLGIITIIDITKDSGFFQLVGFTLIKKTGGNPTKIFLVVSLLTIVMALVIDNIIVLMILIPLVVSITRLLNIKPLPYLMSTAILVNIGGTTFSFSSISNIMIATYAGLDQFEFFLGVGLISLVVAGATILFLLLIVRKHLEPPRRDVHLLQDFDAWIFVPNRRLMYKSAFTFISVVACLIFVPSESFPLSLIALIGMFVLIITSRLSTDQIVKELDIELFLYLLCISVVTGGIDHSGIMQYLAGTIAFLGMGNPMLTTIVILWISAATSVTVDNVPLTQIFLPPIKTISGGFSTIQAQQSYAALALGIGWGDSLTPFGDNILVSKLAEQNDVRIKIRDFFKIGFVSGIFQLYLATIFLIFDESLPLALSLIVIMLSAFFVYYVYVIMKKKGNAAIGIQKRYS